MAIDPITENSVAAGVAGRAAAPGDAPEALLRRYYLDSKGGPGVGFYVDATIPVAAFRDRGRQLTAARADPNAIRDMVAIARHRGWTVVTVKGDNGFRREAWLAARSQGLEVRAYRPSERDLQDLERRTATRERREDPEREPSRAPPGPTPDLSRPGPAARLRIVETVVRARVSDPLAQARLIAAARDRIAGWLDRGARFDEAPRRNGAAGLRERHR